MTQKVYKFEPGQCVCLLGDFGAGSQQANVRKLSGTEMVLEATVPLRAEQFVYTTIKLVDGPSFALSGLVVTSAAGGILVQWMHANPKDADRVDSVLRNYTNQRLKPPVEAAAPAAQPPAPQALPPAPEPPKPAPLATDSPDPSQLKTDRLDRPRRARAEPPVAKAPAVPPPPEQPHDGPMDMDAKLRRKAKTVRSADLASRVETVQIVNMGTIRSLVEEAVDEAIAVHATHMSEADKKRLLEEAEASFAERLSLFKAEKSGLEVQIQALQDSLKKAQGLLEEEKGRVLSVNQFTVSDAGMMELEQRLGRLLEHALKTGSVSPDLAEDMRCVVIKLLDDERGKIREQAQQAQNDRIQLLERKVQRLASSLENAEAERDTARERAQALEASGGVGLRNVMKAGLESSDPRRNRKLGLLKEIFKFNQEIRQRLASEGRMLERAAVEAGMKSERAEEALVAQDLGIKRSELSGVLVEETSSVPARDEEDESQSAIPVLASGPELDPDDMPWESPGEAAPPSQKAKFKRLGSGG